ncbi:hypothetical protein RhiJN_08017 [Ceratobasidium sp. AG-Ba]|nr:hypothetical protein RhiJN_08017 [Ceratobasidium sp. AG-Ba]
MDSTGHNTGGEHLPNGIDTIMGNPLSSTRPSFAPTTSRNSPNTTHLTSSTFRDNIARDPASCQPFAPPSTEPFVAPSLESIPPAPHVQWQYELPLPGGDIPQQQAQNLKRQTKPPQAQGFSAPSIQAPIPIRSQENPLEDGEFGRARKRLRDDQYKPPSDPAPVQQQSGQGSVAAVQNDNMMTLATAQLAQPRSAQIDNTGVRQPNSADAHSEDPFHGALQPEKDEIVRHIYEGNLDDERSADTAS